MGKSKTKNADDLAGKTDGELFYEAWVHDVGSPAEPAWKDVTDPAAWEAAAKRYQRARELRAVGDERAPLRAALAAHGGNVTAVAKALGVSRKKVHADMKELGLTDENRTRRAHAGKE